MSEETKGGLKRVPKAVTKPRVGNPWRESVHGPVGVPTMRVRGGAPNGMPVPSWQADGSPREPREVPVNGAPELVSIMDGHRTGDAYVTYALPASREASRAYVVSRPAASPAESRALPTVDGATVVAAFVAYDTGEGNSAVLKRGNDVLWVDGDARAAHYRAAAELARWEASYIKALASGHASWESIPVHPSVIAERTRALQSPARPKTPEERAKELRPTVVVRELASPPMAHDPTFGVRGKLSYEAPVKGHRYRVRPGLSPELSALSALLPDRVDAREGVKGGVNIDPRSVAAAVQPCAWCDSVACDRARDESLHCKVYDRAVSRGMPEALAYVQAREAFKGPRAAHAAALLWIEDGRQSTIASLRALDARGADIDYRGTRFHTRDEFIALRDAGKLPCQWRDSGLACVGSPIKAMVRNHRAYDTARVDGCHWRRAQWSTLQETLASASAGKVEAAAGALSVVTNAAPRGVWWASELPRWRVTRDAHNGASINLLRALRATRDTTVACVAPSQWEDTVKRVVRPPPDGADARASSVVAAPREKIPASRLPAPRSLPRVVTEDAPKLPPRQWGERPEYPVAPRDRTTDNPSTVEPVAGDPWTTRTAGELCTPPVAPPPELPLLRLTWCGAAPTSGRWIQPLRFARTPRAPLR